MEFITGKQIHRRTFLRGMGASVALPFLDAMVPAGRLTGRGALDEADPTRLVAIELVHGAAGSNEANDCPDRNWNSLCAEQKLNQKPDGEWHLWPPASGASVNESVFRLRARLEGWRVSCALSERHGCRHGVGMASEGAVVNAMYSL